MDNHRGGLNELLNLAMDNKPTPFSYIGAASPSVVETRREYMFGDIGKNGSVLNFKEFNTVKLAITICPKYWLKYNILFQKKKAFIRQNGDFRHLMGISL